MQIDYFYPEYEVVRNRRPLHHAAASANASAPTG